MSQPVFVGLIIPAAVDNFLLLHRIIPAAFLFPGHRPVGIPVLLEIPDRPFVEPALIGVFPDVPDQAVKAFFILEVVTAEILVRPGCRISFSESPRRLMNERF
jgi:hypothetical protein